MLSPFHVLHLPRKMARDMVTHALAETPREMCGALLMREGSDYAEEWIPVKNVASDPTRHYQMDPNEQREVWYYAETKGLQVGGLVHSHTYRDATLSEMDRQFATYPDLFYAVLSLRPRQLRAWSVDAFRSSTGKSWANVREHRVEIVQAKRGLGYCWWHARYENDTGAYRVCFECHHVFATEAELIEQHHRVLAELGTYIPGVDLPAVTSGESVYTCPYCVHDF